MAAHGPEEQTDKKSLWLHLFNETNNFDFIFPFSSHDAFI